MSFADPLFAALTRPAMIWGVTYTGVLLNLMAVSVAFIAFDMLRMLLLFVPIHMNMYLVCWKDPRFFELLKVWVETKGGARAKYYWKASTYGH